MKIHRLSQFLLSAIVLTSLMACSLGSLPFGAKTPTPVPSPTFTASPLPTDTSTATATNTPLPTSTPRPTATPNGTATRQYTDMESLVKDLVKKGYLASSNGKFFAMDDYSNEWAQLGWYRLTDTPYEAQDFVLRADLSWESASQNPNPSGCGIVFHHQPNDDHYLVFVSTTGHVVFYAAVGADINFLAADYFGVGGSKGKATFVLIVTGIRFRALIDGRSVGVVSGYNGRMTDGGLSYTIVSGTNTGYGTRCTMTNVALWQLSP